MFHVNSDRSATTRIKHILSKLQNGIIQMIAPKVKHRSISNKNEHTFINNVFRFIYICIIRLFLFIFNFCNYIC